MVDLPLCLSPFSVLLWVLSVVMLALSIWLQNDAKSMYRRAQMRLRDAMELERKR